MNTKYRNSHCECGNIADTHDYGIYWVCKRCKEANKLANKEMIKYIDWQRATNEQLRLTNNSRRSKARQKEQAMTSHD